MVTLEPVSERTFGKVLDMKLSEEQNRFVAPNIVSMAQAWLYYDTARPMAVMNDGQVVGFMMLDWDEGERNAGVWRFMIAPEHQHKGYGRAALEAAVRLVRDTGRFDLMNLDYVPGNTYARDLYASIGFRENGEVEDGEIVMILPLTDNPQVGALTADMDDLDDFLELIEEEKQAGQSIPTSLAYTEALTEAIKSGQVVRLTLMAETIGLGIGHELLLKSVMRARLVEAEAKLEKFIEK